MRQQLFDLAGLVGWKTREYVCPLRFEHCLYFANSVG